VGVDSRGLPTNVDAERFVLGSMLLDDAVLHEIRAVLSDDEFSLEKHRRIWKRSVEIYDGGGHVDRITVANALMNAGELESCDGLTYLVSLDDGLPQIPNVDSYVQIVKDKAMLRRIIRATDHLQNRCMSQEETPQSILNSLGNTLIELAPQEAGKGLQSIQELIDEKGISTLLQPRQARGIELPWRWLDDATCGMHPGQIWYLAGYTSTGKTSAALQVGVHAARKGTGVAIFNLEMGKISLFQRMVYQIARVDSERAKRNALTSEERKRVNEAASLLADLPIYIDDSMASTVPAIGAAMRRLRLKTKVGLAIVDYLQLLGTLGRELNRAQEVGANSRALKKAAREFECPFLVLSQFKRGKANEKTGEIPKPTLSDFKESGDVENDADVAWFIHRPTTQEQELVPVSFILAKQREGPRDIEQDFYFLPKSQRFDGRDESDGM
jgi:replicative DNA helicase